MRVREESKRLVSPAALRWVMGLAVMVLSIWLLSKELDWALVWNALRDVKYIWVLIGVLATVGTFFTRTWRWQALLWQADLPLLPAMSAILVGQVVNSAIPMRSGDVARAVWIGPQKGTNAPQALGSVALEKVWDLLALFVCGLLLLAVMPLPTWFSRSTWGTALTLIVGGLVLWAGLRWQERLFHWAGLILARFPAGWDQAILPKLRRLAQGLASVRHAPASARALLWTFATWTLGAFTNWAIMAAFGIYSIPASLLLLVGLMVGGAVVQTPARLGVYEGIAVVLLPLFGISDDTAFAIGLILHLAVMVPPLIAAAWLSLWSPSHMRRADEPA